MPDKEIPEGPFRTYPVTDHACAFCHRDASAPNGGWVETTETETLFIREDDRDLQAGAYVTTIMQWSCFDCAGRLGLELESAEEYSMFVDRAFRADRGGKDGGEKLPRTSP